MTTKPMECEAAYWDYERMLIVARYGNKKIYFKFWRHLYNLFQMYMHLRHQSDFCLVPVLKYETLRRYT